MTDIIALVKQQLDSLVNNRVYPLLAPQNAAYPFIVLTLVSAVPQARPLQNNTAIELWRSTIQIDIYGSTDAEAQGILADITTELEDFDSGTDTTVVQSCRLDNYDETFEPEDGSDEGYSRIKMEYILWYS